MTGSQGWTTMQREAHRRKMTQIDKWSREESQDRDMVRQRHRVNEKETGKAGATLRLEAGLGWG